MNDEIVKRMAEFMDKMGLNAASLAKELGYSSQEKISRLFRKEGATPSYDLIYDIANKFVSVLNVEWLVLGIGDMLKKDVPSTYMHGHTPLLVASEPNPIKPIVKEILRAIPVLSNIEVAAGAAIYNHDNINFEESFQMPQRLLKSRDAFYAAPKIKGESMAPTLQDSGYVIARLLLKQEWINMPNEQIFIVTDNTGRSAIKRVKNRWRQGFITLMSDNPDKASFPNYNLEANEILNIWHVEWYMSAKMPNIHAQYYNRLQRLEDKYEDIEQHLKRLDKPKNP